MPERVVIERRFRGPPNSGQGGYACGLLAAHLGGSAEVRLTAPPPLETPLELHRDDDDVVRLLHDGAPVAEARPAGLDIQAPEPVSLAEARAAAERFRWLERHPFPECFGCGPRRLPGDGLCQFAGPVEGSDLFACPWTPDASLADGAGLVKTVFMWAALDCPTATPAVPLDGPACVLGRLRARVDAPARAGRPHTVIAWLIAHEGRRHLGGAAIHDASGRLLGLSEGLWIELRDPAAMGVRSG